MSASREPKLAKWPFYLGDALLLGVAYCICQQADLPLGHWEVCLVVLCVGAGAALAIAPFMVEYRARMKLAEAGALTSVVSQIQNLESVAGQISGATAKWQEAQEQAEKTAVLARDISERMTAEVKAFTEFLQRANDSERATLRLEVDKLRRGENEWLQVLIHMLDHVYALNQGARRSGQPNLIEQLSRFQDACRDAARRVGLAPFTASEAEPFDPQRHQLVEPAAEPPPGTTVADTIATGYTFQGRMLRPALVRLQDSGTMRPTNEATPMPTRSEGPQSQLPLEPEKTA